MQIDVFQAVTIQHPSRTYLRKIFITNRIGPDHLFSISTILHFAGLDRKTRGDGLLGFFYNYLKLILAGRQKLDGRWILFLLLHLGGLRA